MSTPATVYSQQPEFYGEAPPAPRVVLSCPPLMRARALGLIARVGGQGYAPSDLAHGSSVDLVVAAHGTGPEIAALLQRFSGARAWLLIEPPPLEAEPRQGWVFKCSSQIDEASVVTLLAAGVAQGKRARPGLVRIPHDREGAALTRDVLDAVRELSALTDPEAAAESLVRASLAIAAADRAFCWYYDSEAGAVYDGTNPDAPQLLADRGLVAFSARTGASISAWAAGQHSEYGGAADLTSLGANYQVVCQPIVAPDGTCHAVLVVARAPGRDPYSARERDCLECFAHFAGAVLSQLAVRGDLQGLIEMDGLFRREALEAHDALGDQGQVVRVSPNWVPRAHWVLSALLLALLMFLCVGRISQYSSGPAVIRTDNRTDVVSKIAGTVAMVQVSAGDAVEPGQVVARLYDQHESNSLSDLEEQWETQLRHYLLEPGSDSVRQILASLRAQRRTAADQLEERLIRAPRAGIVGEVHTRSGAPLAPGELVASIVDKKARFGVVAFMPASDAPQIKVGMPLRVEVVGYPHSYLDLTVARFSQEATGAAAARRYLGSQLADAIAPYSTTVVVEADLSSDHFVVDGDAYPFLEGTPLHAEARLRAEPIVLALLPWLRSL